MSVVFASQKAKSRFMQIGAYLKNEMSTGGAAYCHRLYVELVKSFPSSYINRSMYITLRILSSDWIIKKARFSLCPLTNLTAPPLGVIVLFPIGLRVNIL